MQTVVRNLLVNEIYHFSRLSHQTGCFFYLGSLLHIIISLFSHFRSWDYPGNFGIYSQLKSKAWSFTFLIVVYMFHESNGTKSESHSFHLQYSGILQTRMDQRRTLWKWILTIYQCKNWVRTQKTWKKMKTGSLVLFS